MQAPKYEFGGPWGTGAMMLGFPAFIYWLWLSLTFNHGQPFIPNSPTTISSAWRYSLGAAAPSLAAATFHITYTAYQWALAQWLPGPTVHTQVDTEDPHGEQHAYVCNAPAAWYITLVLATLMHISGVFDLVWIIDHFGSLMSTGAHTSPIPSFPTHACHAFSTFPPRTLTPRAGILLSLAASIVLHAWAVRHASPADAHAATGNAVYDTFMGILLHPRLGRVHLKMLFDVRVPWALLFIISTSAAIRQHRDLGRVTPELCFIPLAHFLYANATHKGEEHVPCTWDIMHERFGFMLLFWNAAGIPFSYSATSLYLLHNRPLSHHWAFTAAVYVLMLVAYYVWDTANCQKSVFKAQQAGSWDPDRWRAPPQVRTQHTACPVEP